MTPHNITIYSTATCPYCKMAKQYLQSKNIPYRDIDVGEDEQAAQEMIRKSGQMGVPVIEVDGKILTGFQQSALDKLLT